ncbi:MAG: 50S ribosomal protein L25/general stress protein Ctc [Bacteroidales bacterium]|nr:50S ribosomal protein L25/general stress protein Ctc [Bacteroidales bacterium]
MESIEIKGTIRKNIGKKYTKKLRIEEQVPCVLYGGKENIHFHAHKNAFKEIVYTPNAYLIDLNIDGKKYDAIMQDIQFHPVTDEILHLDFYEVSEGKKVIIRIPIKVTGDSEGVKQGGKLIIKRRRLRVKALPKDIPGFLEIDISDLGLGQTKKINELSYDKLELIGPPNAVVCGVHVTRAAKGVEEEEKEAVEEGAEETVEASEKSEEGEGSKKDGKARKEEKAESADSKE